MELFKIGGPNPDTNYLFMGSFCPSIPLEHITSIRDVNIMTTHNSMQETTSIEATTLSKL
jgi:hypothetical protein